MKARTTVTDIKIIPNRRAMTVRVIKTTETFAEINMVNSERLKELKSRLSRNNVDFPVDTIVDAFAVDGIFAIDADDNIYAVGPFEESIKPTTWEKVWNVVGNFAVDLTKDDNC